MLTRLGAVRFLLPLLLQIGSQHSLAALTAAGWIIMASECQPALLLLWRMGFAFWV